MWSTEQPSNQWEVWRGACQPTVPPPRSADDPPPRPPGSVRLDPASFSTSTTSPFNLSSASRSVCQASWLHVLKEVSTGAWRSMRFWDKLGRMELCAMDQIQVNIPLLLLLVAVKSKPWLWGVCVCMCVNMRLMANSVRSARCRQPGRSTAGPEVIACWSGAVCRPLPHFTICASRGRDTAIHRDTQGPWEHGWRIILQEKS